MSKRAKRTVPTPKSRGRLYAVLGAVAVAVVAAGILIALSRGNDDGAPQEIILPERPHTAQRAGLTLGSANAPVTIDVYADFQCPFCGRLSATVEPVLEEQYVATGRARLIYHPMAFLGDESWDAAEAAYCADDQGKFWDYHDMLFANQAGENRGAFSRDRLRSFAEAIDLDMARFDSCLDAGAHRQRVTEDNRLAGERGVRSTPTVFINERRLGGLLPLEQYIRLVEEALAQ